MKQKLIENYIIPNKLIRKAALQESASKVLFEGREYKCIAAYTFPLSRPGQENLNERIYSEALWETVIRNQKPIWEGAFGLCDHPETEGSVKDGFCVWHNLRFSEDKKLILGDAYLFGDYGRHCQEAIEAGGKIGLSSVGYGDFKEDGKTIDESTYEIERPADWVLNPSYQVFGSMEDLISQTSEKVGESTSPITTKKGSTMKESKTGRTLEEKSLRLTLSSMLEKAKAIEDPAERANALSEVLSYTEGEEALQDLGETATAGIKDAEKALSSLAENGKKTPGLESQVTTLTAENKALQEKLSALETKYALMANLLDSTKVQTTRLRELYELQKGKTNGMISAGEYREALTYIEDLEKQLETQKTELTTVKRENANLSAQLKKREALDSSRAKATELEGKFRRQNELAAVRARPQRPETTEPAGETINEQVQNYYEDLELSDPRVEIIKEDILKSKSLFEAQRTFLRLKGLLDEEAPEEDTPRAEVKESLKESKMTSLPDKPEGWV